jgi:hypothetical protein
MTGSIGARARIGACASVSLVGLFAVGCTTGDTSMPPNPNGRVCTTTLTAAGSFAPTVSTPPPTGWVGCWPAGTWTFQMAVVMNDCTPAPTPLAQYQFIGIQELDANGDPIVDKFNYLTDPTVNYIAKVSQEGAGLCEGELDLYSADGKQVWTLKPVLQADNTLIGDGEFGIFDTNQWPY